MGSSGSSLATRRAGGQPGLHETLSQSKMKQKECKDLHNILKVFIIIICLFCACKSVCVGARTSYSVSMEFTGQLVKLVPARLYLVGPEDGTQAW